MDVVMGLGLIFIGCLLLAFNEPLAVRMATANKAATGHFGGPGWEKYNRAVLVVVGLGFVVGGLAAALGLG